MPDILGLVSMVYNPVEDVKSVEEPAAEETIDVGAESSSSLSDSVPSRGSYSSDEDGSGFVVDGAVSADFNSVGNCDGQDWINPAVT